LPVGFFAVLLLAYLFFPIPPSYKVTGAESTAVVERLSFIEKELALSHEMASRMARLVGLELSVGAKGGERKKPESPFSFLAGDENGARIFPLDGWVEPKTAEASGEEFEGLVIRFEKKDSVRASGAGVVAEVVHGNLVNWKVTVLHKNGYATSYAGNFSPLVKRGDVLKLGEVLGLATAPRFGLGRLEFVVLKAGKAVGPFAAFLDKSVDVLFLQGVRENKSASPARKRVSNS
jgi:murein DD-endopeptidase MepM/ murein hydrolase activator NlpD